MESTAPADSPDLKACPPSSSRARLALWMALLGLLGVALMVRWTPGLQRPLEGDELITLKLFTALGYETTTTESAKAPTVDLRRLPKGVGKSFVNSWSPNDHMVHSLAATGAQAFCGMTERSFRLPAMVGSVLLAVALCWLAWWWSGSVLLGVVLGLAAILHPYFMYYGQTARGYSITALLLVAQVAAVEGNRRRPRLWLHWLSGALGVAIFSNLVSMLTMWLAPLYAVLVLLPGQRRRWLAEAVVVMTICGTFILAKLPIFLLSQERWGIPLSSLASIRAMDLPGYLAPGWWMPVLVLGFVGCVWGAFRGQWLGTAVLTAAVCTVAFIVLGKKIPYTRTFGFFLVLAWLGLVQLWQLQAGRPWRWAIPLIVAVPVALALPQARSYRPPVTYSTTLAEVSRHIAATPPEKAGRPLVLLPWIYGEEAAYYLPPGRAVLHPVKENGPVTLYLSCEMQEGVPQFRTQYANYAVQEFVSWPVPEAWQQFGFWAKERYRVFAVPMEAKVGVPETVEAGKAGVLLWQSTDQYFDLKRLVADGLNSGKAPWRLKMSFLHFLQPKLLMVFFTNAEEYGMAKELLALIEKRTSGEAICLTR